MQGVGLVEDVGEQGVTALVKGDSLSFVVLEDHGVALLTHHHPVTRGLEVLHANRLGVATNGVQGGLVHQVRQVRSAHPRRAPRNHDQVHRRVEGFVLRVDLQDRESFFEVGQGHHNLTVEPARA